MKSTQRYIYPAIFSYEDDRQIAVLFPDLDVATSGQDDDDALTSARELLSLTLTGLTEDGEPIPAPTALRDVPLQPNERAVLVDVYTPAAPQNRSVRATVTLPAWMKAKALERGVNLSQALQEALRSHYGL